MALSLMDNRDNPSRQDMKRAASTTVWKLVREHGMDIDELLGCMGVEFRYEESIESKIDKLLWQVFAEVVVRIDKERRRW